MESEALKNLVDKGVTVVECDKEAFRKRVAPQTDKLHQGAPRSEARGGPDPRDAGLKVNEMSVAAPAPSGGRITAPLLWLSDVVAAVLLVADLLVVCVSVLAALPVQRAGRMGR